MSEASEVVQGQPREEENDHHWGDKHDRNINNYIIGYNNVGRLWVCGRVNIDKNESLLKWIDAHKFDIFRISEVGINWRKISNSRNLKTISRNLNTTKALILTAHNEHENKSVSQWGGVGIVVKGKLVNYCQDLRKDPKKLGRWVSICIRGKKQHKTRIFSAYRPNKGGGALSVFSQHERALNTLSNQRDPIKAFDEDHQQEIQNAYSRGESVILLIDANSNTRQVPFPRTLTKCEMHEIIIGKHGSQGPEPYIDNTKNNPINGIFASNQLSFQNSGYFSYFQSFGHDHRVLWTSIREEDLLGKKVGTINQKKKKKLNTNCPKKSVNTSLMLQSYSQKPTSTVELNKYSNKQKQSVGPKT